MRERRGKIKEEREKRRRNGREGEVIKGNWRKVGKSSNMISYPPWDYI